MGGAATLATAGDTAVEGEVIERGRSARKESAQNHFPVFSPAIELGGWGLGTRPHMPEVKDFSVSF